VRARKSSLQRGRVNRQRPSLQFTNIQELAAYPAQGRLVIAPAALGGARSIRAPRDRHCCPRALARCRLSKSHHRPARVAAIGPCRSRTAQRRRAREARAASAVAPVPFLNRMTFSKSAILHRFANFYTLRVDTFWNFFRSSLRMTPMNHEKFHGNRSARFSEIRTCRHHHHHHHQHHQHHHQHQSKYSREPETHVHLHIVAGAASGDSTYGKGGEIELQGASRYSPNCPRTVGVVRIVVGIVRTSNNSTRRVEE